MKDVLFWPVTDLIRQTALQGKNHWGANIVPSLRGDADLGSIHGGTVPDFTMYRQLIRGARLFAWAIGNPMGGIVADLGSGRGVEACVLSIFPEVRQVYAVEYS